MTGHTNLPQGWQTSLTCMFLTRNVVDLAGRPSPQHQIRKNYDLMLYAIEFRGICGPGLKSNLLDCSLSRRSEDRHAFEHYDNLYDRVNDRVDCE
jgi:hypothetical protein